MMWFNAIRSIGWSVALLTATVNRWHRNMKMRWSEAPDAQAVSGGKGETIPPDATAGHNDPVTGLSADGTFHLLSVRGPLTNQFPRT
jgi:hypothetical protein